MIPALAPRLCHGEGPVERGAGASWDQCFRALAAIGYAGPLSVEWEDAGMDRMVAHQRSWSS